MDSIAFLCWTCRNQRRIIGDIEQRLAPYMPEFSIVGRYHRLPRRIEHDYTMSSGGVVGSGLNGEVKCATSRTQRQQKFAVKSFMLTGITEEQWMDLRAEVENYLCTDHPHITRLCDVYEAERKLHLVMEHMEGGELWQRVDELKRFTEQATANTLRQILLALNYLHSRCIAHCDVKLENFVYDQVGGEHLKMIDFGFSQRWNGARMRACKGTTSYVAPEVLAKSYTSQCDLWSVGVIGFTLLSGCLPFHTENETRAGRCRAYPEKWAGVSAEAKGFVISLLNKDPVLRPTAQAALKHPWIIKKRQDRDVNIFDRGVANALHAYSRESKFKRACLQMAAWSLSNEERAKVRSHFLAMDTSGQGVITFVDFRRAMADAGYKGHQLQELFDALASSKSLGLQYSEFLAAMVSTKIDLSDDLLRSTFRRFDVEGCGHLTSESLRRVLGEKEDVEAFVSDADQVNNGQISLPEFATHLRSTTLEDSSVSKKVIQELSLTWSWAKVLKTVDDSFRSLAVATVCGACLDPAA